MTEPFVLGGGVRIAHTGNEQETYHSTASTKSTSHRATGLERGNMIGRLFSSAISLTTSSVNAFYLVINSSHFHVIMKLHIPE